MLKNKKQIDRRNAMKMGVSLATLATAGAVGSAQAHEVKTPFTVKNAVSYTHLTLPTKRIV